MGGITRMRQTSAGEQGIHNTYSCVVANAIGNCPRSDATAAVRLQPKAAAAAIASTDPTPKWTVKATTRQKQRPVQPSEGGTRVLSGAPFGKFNGQLVALRRSE
jgi:hypothetical protein